MFRTKIKAVLFDVDNTLLDTDGFVIEHIKETVSSLRTEMPELKQHSEDEIRRVQSMNLHFEDIFKRLFEDGNIGNGSKEWELVLAKYRETAKQKKYMPLKGALEAVDFLKRKGTVIGLVTNRVKMLDERLIQAGFCIEDFLFMSQPSEKEYAKPHPMAFEEAVAKLEERGINKNEILVVGDHTDDYLSSKYQGIGFVAVLSGAAGSENFKEKGLDDLYIIKDLSCFKSALENIENAWMYMKSMESFTAIEGRHCVYTTKLSEYFSEYALHRNRIRAEVEHILCLSEYFNGMVVRILSSEEKLFLRNLYKNFNVKECFKIMQYDHLGRNGTGPVEHDVKACELWIKEKIECTSLKDIAPFIHYLVTSEDTSNFAYKLMIRGAVNYVLTPSIFKVTELLKVLSKKYALNPLMSRTHFQPASPTTFGKIFSTYLNRITTALRRIEKVELTGKINGAVGNYNCFKAAHPNLDWIGYSKELASRMRFGVEYMTDQRGTHNDIIRLLQAIQEVNNVVRDLSIDISLYSGLNLMNLLKIESHVGSSVMPHKINPWFAEVAEGSAKKANYLINGFSNELDVSRLQRDLSDHEFERSYGEIFGYIVVSLEHAAIALRLLKPDVEYAEEELSNHPEVVTEAIQTILRKHGISGAYEEMKKRFRGNDGSASERIKLFLDNAGISEDVKKEIRGILNPVNYTGLASVLVSRALQDYSQFKSDLESRSWKML